VKICRRDNLKQKCRQGNGKVPQLLIDIAEIAKIQKNNLRYGKNRNFVYKLTFWGKIELLIKK
jgi:hypothetical protein